MARPTSELIEALRTTAARLESGGDYRWTHMGACNCGHLAQTVTHLDRATIHRIALQRAGDWGEQAVEHCPASGLPIDHVIDRMLDIGLELSDIPRLERLQDPRVIRRLPFGQRELAFRKREDVTLYMRTWADLLDEQRALEISGVHRRADVHGQEEAAEAAKTG
ncbi:MAG: hypothetical protein AB8I08_02460 [Sandaracinaceae bacterium]